MAIEITGIPSPQTSALHSEAISQAQQADSPNRTAKAESRTRDDRVSLTDTAERLRKLEDQIAGLPVVDTQRVDAIRQKVVNGTYKVDAGRVADRLLDFESSMSGTGRAR